MKKDTKWLKGEIKNFQEGENMFTDEFNAGVQDALEYAQELIDQLDEPEKLSEEWINEHSKFYTMENAVEISDLKNLLLPQPKKPVLPQFVADWIDTHNLYGNNPLREYRDLESDFNEGWTDEKDAAVYHWVNENPYAFIDALRYGYEVEKEKKYRVRAGNRYVRFNLDGSIIGVKKDNSIVCLERLSKLPFDYKKAVESGIITLEEVTPCN